MIFLVATLIYLECLGFFYLRALRSLGYEVEVWDPRTMSMPVLKEKPDLTIVIKEFVDPRALPRPRVYIFPDQTCHENYGEILDKITPHYDQVFFCMVHEEPIMKRYGASLLPFACDPEIHFPLDLDLSKIIDTSFVGTNRSGRVELIKYLSEHGVNISIWGNNWPPSTSNYHGEAIYLNEKRAVYCASKITLNHHLLFTGPNMRVFEAQGYRCFLISDKTRGMDELGFQNGVHYIHYENLEGLVDLIRKYLDLPDERERISSQGYKFVIENHTYQHRVKELISKCI